MSRSLNRFTILYYALVAVFMTSVLIDSTWLHYTTKPLFMVMLMVFHYQQASDRSKFFFRAIQFGLFFSWLGDIALMLPDTKGNFFLVGLVAFLIAHLGYTFGFYKSIRNSVKDFNYTKAAALLVPFALFTGSFFYYIKDDLPTELYYPVLAYTLVISAMGVFSAWRSGHVDRKSFYWILIGAILFILSDCVIAINKFVVDFEYDKIVNMILYLTGQYMIAVGAIHYNRSLRPAPQDF